MKKVLFVATVVQKHIKVFHTPYLEMFRQAGYEAHVAAANDTGGEVNLPCCDRYTEIGFRRNPFHPANIGAFFRLKRLIDSEGPQSKPAGRAQRCCTPPTAFIFTKARRS